MKRDLMKRDLVGVNKTKLTPLSPKIRTSQISIRIKLNPNFWGAGGWGVRGKRL